MVHEHTVESAQTNGRKCTNTRSKMAVAKLKKKSDTVKLQIGGAPPIICAHTIFTRLPYLTGDEWCVLCGPLPTSRRTSIPKCVFLRRSRMSCPNNLLSVRLSFHGSNWKGRNEADCHAFAQVLSAHCVRAWLGGLLEAHHGRLLYCVKLLGCPLLSLAFAGPAVGKRCLGTCMRAFFWRFGRPASVDPPPRLRVCHPNRLNLPTCCCIASFSWKRCELSQRV